MLRMLVVICLGLAFGAGGAGAARTPAGRRMRPFSGSFIGSSAHDLSTGEFHSVWTGEASSFGISTFEQQARISAAGPGGLRFAGSWTLTAADGDQLCGAAEGTGVRINATSTTLSGDYTATGGTGRFAAASATFKATAQHVRTALEDGISYGEQRVTVEGQLRV